jgi:hypothetical protein
MLNFFPYLKALQCVMTYYMCEKKWWAFMKRIQVAQKSKMTSHVSRESYGLKAPSQYIKKSLTCHYIY